MSGNQAMVKLLLERGADTEVRNNGGHTALMRASARGRYETCKILIDDGNADVHATDNNGDSVIMHAHLGHHEQTERHLNAHIKKREKRLEEEIKAKEATDAKASEL
jgi:ankyrin repeat protein